MMHLVARAGFGSGASWPITERPLLIGRGRNCDISISDSLVSRKHCEILLADGEVHLNDLGSSNSTLVNGQPVNKCILKHGDEVIIGRVKFVLSSCVPEETPVKPATDPSSTITMTAGEAIYLADEFDSANGEDSSRSFRNLAFLFRLGRTCSRVDSVARLVEETNTAVARHFKPEASWIGLCDPVNGAWDFQQSESRDREPPQNVLDLVRTHDRGVLFPHRVEAAGRRELETHLAAPIAWGEQRFGVMLIRTRTPGRVYDETDLALFLSIANVIAPYFHALHWRESIARENEYLRSIQQKAKALIGDSPAMNKVRETIATAVRSSKPVLVLGETGTGKELVASLIHETSPNAKGPFISLNCAAIPGELFASELFGYEKGAFTGAVGRKLGQLELSHGGTLFLDEIGDLSTDNQARILRAIETGKFRRLGGQAEISVQFRLVAATNRDLAQDVEDGKFRRDLYHRIRGFEITIPPLRERISDLMQLVDHFLAMAKLQGGFTAREFSSEALELLRAHTWRGNVRELRNVVETAAAHARGEIIARENVEAAMGRATPAQKLAALAEVERNHIVAALDQCGGRVADAARILGIARSTLYDKITQYGLKT